MRRRLLPSLSAFLLLAISSVHARTVRLPLDPATLGGAGMFTAAEAQVAQAAQAAGLEFIPDSRPRPPQVIISIDTAQAAVQKRHGLLLWRGDMLPDQLAPAETGTLIRKLREADGTWKTTRTQEGVALAARTNLIAVARTTPHFTLPRLIIETPYQLGTLGGAPVVFVLWRTAEEDRPPLAGYLAFENPAPALLDALNSRLPPFDAQADWAAEFDALAP